MCLARHHQPIELHQGAVFARQILPHDIPGVQTPGYSNKVFQTSNASDSVIRGTLGDNHV
jgi:hypothetical protein